MGIFVRVVFVVAWMAVAVAGLVWIASSEAARVDARAGRTLLATEAADTERCAAAVFLWAAVIGMLAAIAVLVDWHLSGDAAAKRRETERHDECHYYVPLQPEYPPELPTGQAAQPRRSGAPLDFLGSGDTGPFVDLPGLKTGPPRRGLRPPLR